MSLDCFTPYARSRSYLLPVHVRSNIAMRGSVGMLGAHHVAHGLLLETCRHTGAHPTNLTYAETVVDGALVDVTATATATATAPPLTVHTRPHPAPPPRRRARRRLVDQRQRCRVSQRGSEASAVPVMQGWIVHRLLR